MRAYIAAAGFIILWIITFIPAWLVLVKLAVSLISPKKRPFYTLWLFVLYIFVIVLPYLYVLLLLGGTSSLLTTLIMAIIALSLVTAVVQVVGARRVQDSLWKSYARVYDGLLVFYPYRELVELVSARALRHVSARSQVADIGAGTGNISQVIVRGRPDVHLDVVEPIKPMLQRAKKKLGPGAHIRFLQQDAVAYLRSQPDESLDVVIVSNVLYIIQDREAFWSELLRTLKPRGVAIITNSDRGGSQTLIAYHKQHDKAYKLLSPRLLLVGFIDNLISQFAEGGAYHFLSQEVIEAETKSHGARISDVVRCYGGKTDGVNLLFTLHKHKQV